MKLFRALFVLLVLLAVLAAGAAAAGWFHFNNEISKRGPTATDTVFTVQQGEGLSTVAARLADEGVIRNETMFKLAARVEGAERALKVGEFEVPAGASASEVLDLLVSGDVVVHRITIPEGRTTAQALRIIEANEVLVGPLPEPAPEEGDLLPDTYAFSRGDTRVELIERMMEAQDDVFEDLWDSRAPDLPFKTREEALILASVVEKETGKADERGEVAGVFVNRLRRGMRLESDPTIIYGVSNGEPLFNNRGQRRTLYRSEIDRETPWNTYQIDGLPATPICNPGRDAIAAVLNPPETEYLFFVADGAGGHAFAKTYREHQRNVASYRRIEAERIAEERAN
ncbi:MAG: endolytic transglycosylase MltG [Pseudomonadota bacterium]